VVERWNNLKQHVADALKIKLKNKFKNKLKQIRETIMCFISLICGLITVEATPGKEH